MRTEGYELGAVCRAVMQTLGELMRDRGYGDVVVQSDATVCASESAIGVLFGADDPRHRTGIQEIRDVASRYPGRRIIAVSHGGATPYLLSKGVEELECAIECFRVQELLRNVTHHHLVPVHSVVPANEVLEILGKYGLSDRACLPALLTTDPVARYYGWSVGTVVRIARRDLLENGTMQCSEAMRIVTAA